MDDFIIWLPNLVSKTRKNDYKSFFSCLTVKEVRLRDDKIFVLHKEKLPLMSVICNLTKNKNGFPKKCDTWSVVHCITADYLAVRILQRTYLSLQE